MRELRVQVGGRPLRVFYAFDPRWVAILPIVGLQPTGLTRGGDKTGRDDFYTQMIPLADRLYDEHLAEIAADRTGGTEDDGG
jgi:hypothetical protein